MQGRVFVNILRRWVCPFLEEKQNEREVSTATAVVKRGEEILVNRVHVGLVSLDEHHGKAPVVLVACQMEGCVTILAFQVNLSTMGHELLNHLHQMKKKVKKPRKKEEERRINERKVNLHVSEMAGYVKRGEFVLVHHVGRVACLEQELHHPVVPKGCRHMERCHIVKSFYVQLQIGGLDQQLQIVGISLKEKRRRKTFNEDPLGGKVPYDLTHHTRGQMQGRESILCQISGIGPICK